MGLLPIVLPIRVVGAAENPPKPNPDRTAIALPASVAQVAVGAVQFAEAEIGPVPPKPSSNPEVGNEAAPDAAREGTVIAPVGHAADSSFLPNANPSARAQAMTQAAASPSNEPLGLHGRYLPTKELPLVTFGPSLRLDSALAASAGLSLLIKLKGECGHGCFGGFMFLDGEIGLLGRQARLGISGALVEPILIRHVLFNALGLSLATAYLHRIGSFEGTFSTPERYAGATLGLTFFASFRVGIYQRIDDNGVLAAVSIGSGF